MQNRFGGVDGNCFEACVASILEIGIGDVPLFRDGRRSWWSSFIDWLRGKGLTAIAIPHGGYRPLLEGAWAIASGISPRKTLHAVVWHEGKIVHDPHPEGGGLVSPKKKWDWTVIVPLDYGRFT